MSNKPVISDAVLLEMNYFLNNEKQVGQTALPVEMLFITDGAWLKDAAVIDAISNRDGTWDIYLVFAHHKKPLQLIVRYITVNTTQIDPLSPFQIDPLKNDFKKALKKPAFADRKSDKELLSC